MESMGPMEPNSEVEVVGAIKIKDGLFIGDEFASKDLEFVMANKVTHIINCAGSQIQNQWESIGVAYLTYNFLDIDEQIILDSEDRISNETFNFIQHAHMLTEGVLIHSIKGQSRACTITVAYLMRRYQWNLLKALEFMSYRRPDLEIRTPFIQQLSCFEERLPKLIGFNPTTKWSELTEKSNPLENEELVLRNTYLNAQIIPPIPISKTKNVSKCKIGWTDLNLNLNLRETENKESQQISSNIEDQPEEFLTNSKILAHKVIHSIKSIFKKYRAENVSSQIPHKENPNPNKSDARPITQEAKSNVKISIPQISDPSFNNSNKRQITKEEKNIHDDQVKDIKNQKYLNPPSKTSANFTFSSGVTNKTNIIEDQIVSNHVLDHNRVQNSISSINPINAECIIKKLNNNNNNENSKNPNNLNISVKENLVGPRPSSTQVRNKRSTSANEPKEPEKQPIIPHQNLTKQPAQNTNNLKWNSSIAKTNYKKISVGPDTNNSHINQKPVNDFSSIMIISSNLKTDKKNDISFQGVKNVKLKETEKSMGIFRNGPIKPSNEPKLGQKLNIMAAKPDGIIKPRKPTYVNKRPSSPGIKGKKIDAPFGGYAKAKGKKPFENCLGMRFTGTNNLGTTKAKFKI